MRPNARPSFVLAPAVVVFAILGLAGATSLRAQDQEVQDPKLPKDPHRAVTELPAQKSAADGHPVRVVDGKNQPLAGVSVVVMDTRAVSRGDRRKILEAARKKYPGDPEAAQLATLVLHGKRYVTDEKGEAKFARVKRGMVVAVKGRMVAVSTVFLRAGREPRQFQMILRPKPGIDVVVVDHKDRPLRNVPVRLIWRTEHGSSWGELKNSGAGGRVHFNEVRKGNYGPEWASYIEANVPTKKRVAVRIDPDKFENDPANPVKLKLPPFGMVRVYVVDDKKRPVHGVERIFLSPLNQEHGQHDSYMASEVKGDSALFPLVEVGLQFEVSCHYKGQSLPQRAQSDGPRHPMDLRVVTLEGITAPRVLTFKLMDEKGEPVKNEPVGVIVTLPNYMNVRVVSTAKDGTCKVTLDSSLSDLEDGVLTVTRRGKGRDLVYRGAARTTLDRARKTLDLGGLKLQKEDLLVAGRVVDAKGNPVSGVYVSTPHHYRLSNRGGSSTSGDPKFHQHRVRTDKEGRFEFRELGADPVSVSLSIDSWMGRGRQNYYIVEGQDADAGAKDHKVVVGETSKLFGSFAGLPKSVQFDGSVALHEKDGPRVKNGSIYTRDDGTFEMERCPPGEYDMVFKLSGAQEPFLVVKGVKVEPGKPCKDPRLQKVDLSKYCHVVKLTVLQPDKTPLANATVWRVRLKDGKPRGANGSSTNQRGELTICAPFEGVNLSIMARNGQFRAEQFAAVKKDMTVVLKPGWRAKFKIKNWPKLPLDLRFATSFYITSRADKAWGMALNPSRTTRYVDSKGEVEFGCSWPGKFRLSLTASLRRGAGRTEGLRGGRLQFEVDVKEKAEGTQTFELELSEDELAAIQEYIEAAKEKRN